MSDTKICNIINNLTFTEKERTTLCSYFYKNSDVIDKAISYLDTCKTSNEKLDFIKETFLKN
ncbi:693_t:CDS:1, partial [Funneliformis mosseae]